MLIVEYHTTLFSNREINQPFFVRSYEGDDIRRAELLLIFKSENLARFHMKNTEENIRIVKKFGMKIIGKSKRKIG